MGCKCYLRQVKRDKQKPEGQGEAVEMKRMSQSRTVFSFWIFSILFCLFIFQAVPLYWTILLFPLFFPHLKSSPPSVFPLFTLLCFPAFFLSFSQPFSFLSVPLLYPPQSYGIVPEYEANPIKIAMPDQRPMLSHKAGSKPDVWARRCHNFA